MGKIAAGPAAYRELVLMEAFSRHPTGNPLFIEQFLAAAVNDYAIGQSVGGTGTLTLYNAANIVQNVYSGRASFALLSSNVNGGFMEMVKPQALTKNQRFGLEVLFGFPYNIWDLRTRCSGFAIRIAFMDHSGQCWEAGVIYNPSGSITVNGVVVQNLSGLEVDNITPIVVWQNAKLIIDANTKKYVKLYWNDLEIDLSSIAILPATYGPFSGARVNPDLTIYDITPAVQYTVYIGGFIFTNEE